MDLMVGMLILGPLSAFSLVFLGCRLSGLLFGDTGLGVLAGSDELEAASLIALSGPLNEAVGLSLESVYGLALGHLFYFNFLGGLEVTSNSMWSK